MAEMRNLLTDPWPNGTAGWDIISGTTGNVEFRMCNDGKSFLIQTRPIFGMVPGSSETVDHLHLEVTA